MYLYIDLFINSFIVSWGIQMSDTDIFLKKKRKKEKTLTLANTQVTSGQGIKGHFSYLIHVTHMGDTNCKIENKSNILKTSNCIFECNGWKITRIKTVTVLNKNK